MGIKSKIGLLSLMVLVLAGMGLANVEIHINDTVTDTDSNYETVGIEQDGGTDGVVKFRNTSGYISQVAYGFSFSPRAVTQYTQTYSWTNMFGATELSLSDDEVSGWINLGFNTDFYQDGLYDKIRVSSNGFITFDDSTNHGCCEGQDLPDSSAPNNLIAGWWEDLLPASAGGVGTIKYKAEGSAPDRKITIEIKNVGHYGDTSKKVSFQIQLFESS